MCTSNRRNETPSEDGRKTLLGKTLTVECAVAMLELVTRIVRQTASTMIIWSYDHIRVCSARENDARGGTVTRVRGEPVEGNRGESGSKCLRYEGPQTRIETNIDHGRPWSTMADHGRPWSTMVDPGRPLSTMADHVFFLFFKWT